MSAPEIVNNTDFVVEPHLLLEHDGEKLVTIVKATFAQDATGVLAIAPEQRPIRFADEPWGDPTTTPARYPADACGTKPATDVVVVADGHAPGGKPVASFDVALKIGPVDKTLRVYGLRVWQQDGAGLSAPRPLTRQAIRYDFAWGGIDPQDPSYGEPRNPVGLGVVRDKSRLTHQTAPCIEDPLHPIGSVGASPAPAGLGAIGPHWMPRRQWVGTYDEPWLRDQAPLLPADFDARANQCATPDLIASPYLQGGEEVGLLNLHPGGGAFAFLLPVVPLVVTHHRRGQAPKQHRPPLDTVLIDTLDVTAPSRVTVELVWRTVTPMPRYGRQLRVHVHV